MTRLAEYLAAHWFAGVLLVAALATGGGWLAGRRQTRSMPLLLLLLLLTTASLLSLSTGGWILPAAWGFWVVVTSLSVLFLMIVVLIVSRFWWTLGACVVSCCFLVGLGGLAVKAAGDGLKEIFFTVLSLEPTRPWWLLLLVLMPVIFWLSFRSLAGLGPIRRWVAIGLRCILILLLTLALAEVRLRHQNESVTVLFLLDRTHSVPEDLDLNSPPGTRIDRREERIRNFLNATVQSLGAEHERDKAGLIVFGRRPRLEIPPNDARRFSFREVASEIDGNYTDIASAIKLALASYPEGSSKRIVLISDGNENLGNAEEQARLAKINGVQIDVIPLAAGQRNENDILVESIQAPSHVEQGSSLPLRVLVRSQNPLPVAGILSVRQVVEGQSTNVPDSPRKVILQPGLTAFTFKQLPRKEGSYTYEAEFQPEGVVQNGKITKGLPGDRVQNNRATTHVVARGQRRILLVEVLKGEHQYLVEQLHTASQTKFDVRTITAAQLPVDRDKLAVALSNFDCLILANVPADALTESQQEVIRSNTHEQGCGLVMIGGPEGYGAGGWQNTPIEKALPVNSDIKALKIQGKGGLVLIMHASEMANGNFWQKKIAKLAINKLSSIDEVGVLHFDWGVHKWHIPLQEIGDKKAFLLRQIDKLVPGDMPDFDGPLRMAYDALTDPARELATKHIIVISDGDPSLTNNALLSMLSKAKVTVSTVGVATHGAPQDQILSRIASSTRGRFHKVVNPQMLPAIYIKESRIVSQAFLYEKQFQPQLLYRAGPTDNLPKLPPLYGFVRTTAKPNQPLVEVPIESPVLAEQRFPILAYWHYGLGKSVAFTSDARTQPGRKTWDRDWAQSAMYAKFWEQVVDWAVRPTESKNLAMTTEVRDGKMRVTVDARDDKNRPLTDLNLRGGVTAPSGKEEDSRRLELNFKQKSSGVYEAEVKAEEAGSYFVNVQAVRKIQTVKKDAKGKDRVYEVYQPLDSVRTGVTIPYSPEYSDLESNTALLARLRATTEGLSYADDEAALIQAARSGQVFRPGLSAFKNLQPVWHWLLLLSGVLFLFDVAVRRVAVEPMAVAAASQRLWERLRGRARETVPVPEYFDRLRQRKAQISETLVSSKAANRFDAGDTAAAAPPVEVAPTPPTTKPAAKPISHPAAEASQRDQTDYFSRLAQAKQRARQEKKEEDKED